MSSVCGRNRLAPTLNDPISNQAGRLANFGPTKTPCVKDTGQNVGRIANSAHAIHERSSPSASRWQVVATWIDGTTARVVGSIQPRACAASVAGRKFALAAHPGARTVAAVWPK